MKAPLRFAILYERKVILLLCAIGALRVFIFSAAFPFFNNVDEQAHVDLVMKYARGHVPRDLGQYSSESAYYISLYGTPEFFMAPQQFETKDFPPPNWMLPAEQRDDVVKRNSDWWRSNQNHESGEPPLYYALAGLWLNLGRVSGITGGWLLYWVRFLNMFVAAALVWVGFVAAKLVFPDRQFMRLSVPLLLAVWPQTAFYSIQSDVLSPLCFGVAFVALIKFLQAEQPTLYLAVLLGLALAATCLVKFGNVPLLAVALGAATFKVRQLARTRRLPAIIGSLSLLMFSVTLPIALWFVWNVQTFGDLTATAAKIEFLGWTRKPITSWLPHPIFSFRGLKEFWPELVASFWRGELLWHGRRLVSHLSDVFYWVSSTAAIGFTVTTLVRRDTQINLRQRSNLWLALLSFAVLVVSTVLLSISFDYGECVYPSREHPYFTSGRLLSAAAVPFFLFYAQTIDALLSPIRRLPLRVLLFGGIVLFIVVSEIILSWPAFSSHYNLFHFNKAQ